MRTSILMILILPVILLSQTIPTGNLIEGFENIRDWTLGDSQSYDLIDKAHFTEGASSILLGTNSTLVTPTIAKKISINFKNYKTFSIDLYQSDIPGKTNNIGVELSSKSFENFCLRANITVGTRIYKGWNRLLFDKADFALRFGTENWNNTMKKMRFSEWIDNDISKITFDNFRAYEQKATPVAIITFDDGLSTQKTIAKPILDSLDLKATIFVFGKAVNSVNSSYLRWADLESIYEDGWDISNHTYSHISLLNLSSSVLESEVNGMRDTLIKHGFLSSSDFFSYPMGNFDVNVIAKVKEKHKLARNTYNWQYLPHPTGIGDDYYLLREHNETAAFAEQCRDIDRAISRGQLLVYLFHDISSYSGKFSAIMHYLKSKQDAGLIKIMTMSQYWQFLQSGKEGLPKVNQIVEAADLKFNLGQNYPNPFNSTTIINYNLKQDGFITLKIYNMLGQEVQSLVSDFQSAGSHHYEFNASGLATGIYFYKLESQGNVISRKMILLK